MASDPQSRTQTSPQRGLQSCELEEAVGFWLRLAQQKDLRLFGQALEGEGVTQVTYSMLLLIAENPGCRQADLAAVLRIRQPNLVEPIEALIGRGLVSRRPDPADRRAQVLELTAQGQAVVKRLRQAHGRLINAYRAALGEENYDQLVNLLRRFTAKAADH
jgi:DNA-binding MarR family transcriptional regulator